MSKNLITIGSAETGPWIPLKNLEIEGKGFRVRLRTARTSDLDLIAHWWQEPHAEVNYNRDKTLADEKRVRALKGSIPSKYAFRPALNKLVEEIPFMIESTVHAEHKRPIGIIVLSEIDWQAREAETRTFIEVCHKYVLNGPEAKMLLLKFVFEILGFERMHAWFIGKPSDDAKASPLNHPSYRFNFKCGFRVIPKDTKRGFVERGNRKYDLIHMVILAKWWPRAYRSYLQNRRIRLGGPRVFHYNHNSPFTHP